LFKHRSHHDNSFFKTIGTKFCLKHGYICKRYHNFGVLIINGLNVFYGTPPGSNGIVSTATAAAFGYLELKNARMFNDSGTLLNINKTGDCNYVLDTVARDEATDTLTGTQVLTENAVDIKANHTPVNYTKANDSIDGHISGIDDVLINPQQYLPVKVVFGFDFQGGDTIDFTINGTPVTTVPFHTNQATTMNDIKDQIETDITDSTVTIDSGDPSNRTLFIEIDSVEVDAVIVSVSDAQDDIIVSNLDEDDEFYIKRNGTYYKRTDLFKTVKQQLSNNIVLDQSDSNYTITPDDLYKHFIVENTLGAVVYTPTVGKTMKVGFECYISSGGLFDVSVGTPAGEAVLNPDGQNKILTSGSVTLTKIGDRLYSLQGRTTA
jgi:hypothetical protein